MRASLAAAACVVLGALLAGCSNASQSSPALPGASGVSQMTAHPIVNPDFVKGRIPPMKLLQLQAEGKLPGPIPTEILKQQYEQLKGKPRPHFKHGDSATVKMWASDTDIGYLVGENQFATKTISALDTEANGCYYPITVWVDDDADIWSSCEYNSGFNGSAVEEWTDTGTMQRVYVGGCPAPVSACEDFYAYSFSAAANATDVFSALTYFEWETPSGETYGGGFEWWPEDEPSATPTLIALPYGAPVYDVYYMDVDNSGNLWFDYYGYDSTTSAYGYGLAEIETPTTDPTFVAILPPGTLEFAGGVYVSNGGTTLNVTDQDKRVIYQYVLPLSPGGAPFNTLGPTKTNKIGFGDPVQGGFNLGDTKVVQGDAYGFVDYAKVATNTWSRRNNTSLYLPEGAAYTPSDK
jgi:hypothetical protein